MGIVMSVRTEESESEAETQTTNSREHPTKDRVLASTAADSLSSDTIRED